MAELQLPKLVARVRFPSLAPLPPSRDTRRAIERCASHMVSDGCVRVFIFGISGAVGGRVARELAARGDEVAGLVRTAEQQSALRAPHMAVSAGDLALATVEDLSAHVTGSDAIVYSAGSNGGKPDVTDAIDAEALARSVEAARRAEVRRFILVSVFPESWRERDLSDDLEYYFAVKKRAEVELTRSELDWVILRPSLLTDDPGQGTVALGPAEIHEQVSRADVALTVAEVVHEPRIRRQILELNSGSTPVRDAVRLALRD